MTAKDIQKALDQYYADARYTVSNTYLFGNGYGETDFLVVKNGNGWVYDIEVKVDRGDFFRDMKKEQKHRIISTGTRVVTYGTYAPALPGQDSLFVEAGEPIECKQRPNRFYFAVPENLVKVTEVPDYAGLLYVSDNGRVTKVKEAKVLHKEIINVENKLCRKFYYAYRELILFRQEEGINKLQARANALDKQNTELLARTQDLSNQNWFLASAIDDLIKSLPVQWTEAIQPEHVDYVPRQGDKMRPGIIYISEKAKRATHLCFCGCNSVESIWISPQAYNLIEKDGKISISPLLQSYGPCKSRYYIQDNNVNFIYHGRKQPNTANSARF